MFDLSKYGFRNDYDCHNRFHLMYYISDYYISTVDFGTNLNLGSGKPLYYETMVFKEGSLKDLYFKRYSTMEQAIKGHKKVVNMVKHWV